MERGREGGEGEGEGMKQSPSFRYTVHNTTCLRNRTSRKTSLEPTKEQRKGVAIDYVEIRESVQIIFWKGI